MIPLSVSQTPSLSRKLRLKTKIRGCNKGNYAIRVQAKRGGGILAGNAFLLVTYPICPISKCSNSDKKKLEYNITGDCTAKWNIIHCSFKMVSLICLLSRYVCYKRTKRLKYDAN